MPAPTPDLNVLLREQFGHESFRPGQERIIRNLLKGRDVLAVLPTGAGKSLVFQLAAQLLPGATLVVSPLIALMKDQAESMEARGVEAGVINSARTASQAEEDLQRVERTDAKLLYVTPERFADSAFMAEMQRVPISLLVVDEAHCLSEWGYDFRPAYLGLGGVAERLGRPTLLALTATATPWVRRDIIERLGMRDPDVVVRSVDRPNLFFEVRPVQTPEEEYRVLRGLFEDPTAQESGSQTIRPSGMRSLLAEPGEQYAPELAQKLAGTLRGSGLIYTNTTRAAQETAEWLRGWGIAADYYHGQRKKSDRTRIQDAFMAGDLRVIAATDAFGLGVDKPDVRFVIHREIPASVEAYYQEAGRAGRDGQLARCLLLYRQADLGRAAFLSSSGHVTRDDVEKLRSALKASPGSALPELLKAAGLGKSKGARTVTLLEQAGLMEEREGQHRPTVDDFDPEQVSLEREESHREYERSRLQMMRQYAELRDCRRAYLLNYFGQEADAPHCAMCDNDRSVEALGNEAQEAAAVTSLPFALGDRVRHVRWGEGDVVSVDGNTLAVRFQHGEEKLAADVVQEERLLTHVRRRSATKNHLPEPLPSIPLPDAVEGLSIGEHVVHDLFGEGDVQRLTEDSVTVLFERAGYKVIDVEAVEDGELVPAEALEEEAPTGRGE